MQVLFVSDPELLPTLFDRSLYPPNAHVLDRPVDSFLKKIDAVWNFEPLASPIADVSSPHSLLLVILLQLHVNLLDATLAE